MMIRILLSLLLVVGVAGNATATSCMPNTHSYYARCDGNGCQGVYAVVEVDEPRVCGRRPVVEDIDPQVGDFVSKLVVEMQPQAHGLYQLSLSHRYWHAQKSGKYERFLEALEDTLPLSSNGEACKARELTVAETAKQLAAAEHRGKLVKVTDDATVQGANTKRKALEKDAFREHLESILYSVVFWGGSLIALLVLTHSVHQFYDRLHKPVLEEGRSLLLPLGLQLALGAIGVAAAVLAPLDFWPELLLVPAVILVLLAEGWASWLVRRRG